MSEKAVSVCKFTPGLNAETAKWVNDQHGKIEKDAKRIIEVAVGIGEVLYRAQEKCKHGIFLKWLEESVCFTQRSAYRYIALFNYKDQISAAKNLTQAYKLIDATAMKQKEDEEKKADKRVIVYEETGKKPEGWRRGTDDKRAKKKPVDGAKKDGAKKSPVAKRQVHDAVYKIIPSVKQEAVPEKYEPKKDDSFKCILMDYLDCLPSNSSRILALNNIIKMCREIKYDLE